MGLKLPKRAQRILLGTFLSVSVLVMTACSAEGKNELQRLAMPAPATKEAQYLYTLWNWTWVAVGAVGLLVWGLIIYSIIRYRRRSDDEVPVQMRYHLPIEILYTVAPVVIVIAFFFFTVQAQNGMLVQGDRADAVKEAEITVVGQQWSWTFNYENVKALDGETVHEGGTAAEWPTLWMVKDQPTKITLRSPDVIHSFWVPAFGIKMDIIPARNTENNFILTPDRVGEFDGVCAEFCGVYHSRMRYNVKVTTQEEFDAHMRELQAQGNTGKAYGSDFVNQVPGLKTNDSSGGDK